MVKELNLIWSIAGTTPEGRYASRRSPGKITLFKIFENMWPLHGGCQCLAGVKYMNKAGAARPRDSGPLETIASNVGERLRSDILEGRLEPGARLRLAELREKYDVGISPLREALMRLTSEGLVALEDHRGFKVVPMSREQLLDITFMRRELEGKAIRLSVERGDARWEAQVVAAFHELATLSVHESGGVLEPQWELAHRNFHTALGSACGSKWLIHFRTLLYDQWDRYRRLWFRVQNASPASRDILDEHRELMLAVTQRDADAAVYHMQRHISASTRVLMESEDAHFEENA